MTLEKRPIPKLNPVYDPETADSSRKIKHWTSWTCLCACPILILLPPRRLNILAMLNSAATVASANRLVKDYRGYSPLSYVDPVTRVVNVMHDGIPVAHWPTSKAAETKERLRVERETRRRRKKAEAEALERGQESRQVGELGREQEER